MQHQTQTLQQPNLPSPTSNEGVALGAVTLALAIIIVWGLKTGMDLAVSIVMKQRKRKKLMKRLKELEEVAKKEEIKLYGSDKFGYPTIIKSKTGWEFL